MIDLARHSTEGLSGQDRIIPPATTVMTSDAWLPAQPAITVDPENEALTTSERRERIPNWLGPTIGRLNEFLALPPNWDSYGAPTISVDILEYALRILSFTMDDATPLPTVVPTSEGGVQVEWHEMKLDIEIEVNSTSRITVSFEDGSMLDAPWERELTIDLTSLRQAIDKLTARAVADGAAN